MTREEADNSVGQLVMSCDAGDRMIRKIRQFHGPYRLESVTKSGMAVLENRGPIPPSLIKLAPPSEG